MDNILKLMDEYIKHEKIEELEEIKEEIMWEANGQTCARINASRLLSILDKHIEKLKEE